MSSQITVDVFENTIQEMDSEGASGTAFPFGDAVKYLCDEHRRSYTVLDALETAIFVNQSSWMKRGR